MPVKTWAHIQKRIKFDAGHRIPKHGSKCRNLHGHEYKVIVHCRGTIVDERGAEDEGMLVDFGVLKAFMVEHIHDVLDHGFIIYQNDFAALEAIETLESLDQIKHKTIIFPYVPTAENIARWCFEQLEPCVKSHFRDNLVLDHVEVWETETSAASYPEVLRT